MKRKFAMKKKCRGQNDRGRARRSGLLHVPRAFSEETHSNQREHNDRGEKA
jgi:hypothetical protein